VKPRVTQKSGNGAGSRKVFKSAKDIFLEFLRKTFLRQDITLQIL